MAMQTYSKDLCDKSSEEGSDNSNDERPSFGGEDRSKNGLEGAVGTSNLDFRPMGKSNKRELADPSYTDPKFLKMMMQYGYVEGEGLGKDRQGISTPITASNQQARRGFGYSIPGLDADPMATWERPDEYVNVKEKFNWLRNPQDALPDEEELRCWIETGAKVNRIDNENDFCDADVVKKVVESKTIFDNLDKREMRQARGRSNPFETIGKLFFQNRAAPKMANMDAVFDFMFTKPKREDGAPLVSPTELFYFADVCAAPGGFSEYVLWRNKEEWKGLCQAKGFGFTLKENDFKMTDFLAASPEFLEPHYGKHGDGDVFKSDNITSFASFVREHSDGRGVHLMMADGGFSVEGNECMQEILSKQLYLCQFLTALTIVRDGGNFVCKVFDLFTPFSVGLVYLMYLCFKEISIHKPNTSRPANSERYLICKWKRSNTGVIENYMFLVNECLQNRKEEDIISVVPHEILAENDDFFQYVCNSNETLGKRQIMALQKIQTFCKNEKLIEFRQSTLKKECIAYWKLPNKVRQRPSSASDKPNQKIEMLLQNSLDKDVLSTKVPELSLENIGTMSSRHDYHFVVLASSSNEFKQVRGFFFGMGGKKVWFYNTMERKWKHLPTKIELPCDTLVFAELVTEITPAGKKTALHLIDGILLNGFDMSRLKLSLRHLNLNVFANSINRPTDSSITPIRCKQLHIFRSMDEILRSEKRLRLVRQSKKFLYHENYLPNHDPIEVNPTGVLFLKNLHVNWSRRFSKSARRLYYFNTKPQESKIDIQDPYEWNPAYAGCTKSTLENGFYWWWNSGACLTDDDETYRKYLAHILSHLESLPP